MKPSADARFAVVVAGRSDDELVRMFARAADWQPEALEAARAELMKRNVPVPVAVLEHAAGVTAPRLPSAVQMFCVGVARMGMGLFAGVIGMILLCATFGSSGPQPEPSWVGAAVFATIVVVVAALVGWGLVTVVRGLMLRRHPEQ
ncbi:MAG TPA: hypothetical protein VD994_11550 [Prosthecobacter sp.]|nr:hypothetical protein [Prosthecobacter sp.]